jgi:microcystin-dependent protein
MGGVVIESSDNIAPGTVAPFPHNNIPDGWLLCNGASLNKNIYLNLFNKIGYTYSSVNSGDFFNVPNYNGLFLRGYGSYDTNRKSADYLNVVQGDALGSHNHSYQAAITAAHKEYGGGDCVSSAISNLTTGDTGDIETRPINRAVVYCIKY